MDKAFQLNLFDKRTPIETVVVAPTKDIPFEVFKQCYHLSYFMELMERLPDGRVIWDESVEDLMSASMAEVLYEGMQNDFFSVSFELPKVFYEKLLNDQA